MTNDNDNIYNNITRNSSLLVLCETLNTKPILIESFKRFSTIFDVPTFKVQNLITRHGDYFTNGKYYFKYNSKLPFLQKFRNTELQSIKLQDFFKGFAPLGSIEKPVKTGSTWFWTITRKTFDLKDLEVAIVHNPNSIFPEKIQKIGFKEITHAEKNLRALLVRLKRYGFDLKKYILVPEIKDSEDNKFNYHYHMIVQPAVNLPKILKIRNPVFRDLVYDNVLGVHRQDGYINLAVLSAIWKEITADGSYRILAEEIKDRQGCFNYLLSYLNKPIQCRRISNVPYMYFALKSHKSYRIKGLKRGEKLPKVEYELLDKKGDIIKFDFAKVRFLKESEIPIKFQYSTIRIYKNDILVKEKRRLDVFNSPSRLSLDGRNNSLSDYGFGLSRVRNIIKIN